METWNGYRMIAKELDGHSVILVQPHEADAGRPWVWRAEFFGAFAAVDLALLRQGWHVAYYCLSDLYGSPQAVEGMKRFHTHMVNEYKLSPKAALFGFSRGGLYAVNYAAEYPLDVASLYLDAPVLDIRCWPGGLGKTPRSRTEWEQCKSAYALSERQAIGYSDSPMSKVPRIVEGHIPVIIVAGDNDLVVDFEENSKRFARAIDAAGGKVRLIVKPGIGHHPHSLENPDEIVEFILAQHQPHYRYWHPERRFGMFIHWGIYALTGWHEQYQMRAQVGRASYEKFAAQFSPVAFDPDAWVSMAKEAGMRYICFTAKHHDGFCMWDTRLTDFKITNTPYGEDVLKMLADACAKQDMGLCLYYSLPDWHHPNSHNPLSTHQIPLQPGDMPDFNLYKEYVRRQMMELMSGYGKILGLFWDIKPNLLDPSINQLVRRLQPGIMINDRGFDGGDFSTPERHVPDGHAFDWPTEACQSVGLESWGYREKEDYYSDFSLQSAVSKTMAMGGNYLLNVGPDALGLIPAQAEAIVRRVGRWYNRVREAFEGAKPYGFLADDRFLVTCKDNALYLHFPQPSQALGLTLYPLNMLPESAEVLNDKRPVEFALMRMPGLYQKPQDAYLHLGNLPVNEYAGEVMVIKLVMPDTFWILQEPAKV